MQRIACNAFRSIRPLVVAPYSRISSRYFTSSFIVSESQLKVVENPAIEETIQENSDYKIHPSVFALGARLNLNLPSKVLKHAITHPSFGDTKAIRNNSRLAFLGKAVLGCYVAEYFHLKYPNLPATAFNEAIGAYVSYPSLAHFGREVGLKRLVLWKRSSPNYDMEITEDTAIGSVIAAFVGAIYDLNGAAEAKRFIHHYVLSRYLDIKELLLIPVPKRHLAALMKRQGRPPPESRLLKESGRTSSSPVFLVGTFVNDTKISEGYGSSLQMAEERSSYNALVEYYLREVKDFTLPSDVDEGKLYVPTELGDTQAII